MRGYDDSSYGDAFADVYDDWYGEISDVAATTAMLADLAALCGDSRVLELGVGTGRLAIPLAAKGLDVAGIDSSPAMLSRLAAKPGGELVVTLVGDMAEDLPDGPFAVVFVAYNTLFNLPSAERQLACFRAVAARLTRGGTFVVEGFVPDTGTKPESQVSVRSVTADRVVLSVSTSDPADQRAEGQYVDITESDGVRLRPWSIRWATPEQLDAMAAAAGLTLVERWETFAGSPFGPDSPRHVSLYRVSHVTSQGPSGPPTGVVEAVG